MNCPNCGKEMQPGWIYGKAPLLWSPKQGKVSLLLGKEDVNLIRKGFPAAFICKDCRKVILQY